MAAWRNECGLMCRAMPATFAILTTMLQASRRSIGLPVVGRRTSDPSVRSARHASRTRRTGTVIGMVAGLFPLPTKCRTRCQRRVSAWSSMRTAAAPEARRALIPGGTPAPRSGP